MGIHLFFRFNAFSFRGFRRARELSARGFAGRHTDRRKQFGVLAYPGNRNDRKHDLFAACTERSSHVLFFVYLNLSS